MFELLCLKPVRDTLSNKKGFYKYGSNKWNFRENKELTKEEENLVIDNMK